MRSAPTSRVNVWSACGRLDLDPQDPKARKPVPDPHQARTGPAPGPHRARTGHEAGLGAERRHAHLFSWRGLV